MAAPALTPNSVPEVYNGNNQLRPTLQCIGIKPVVNNSGAAQDRYRLALCDGDHWLTVMLASQLNPMVKQDQIKVGTILQLGDFIVNQLNGRQIIIAITLNVLGHGPVSEAASEWKPGQQNGQQNGHADVGSRTSGTLGGVAAPGGGPSYGGGGVSSGRSSFNPPHANGCPPSRTSAYGNGGFGPQPGAGPPSGGGYGGFGSAPASGDPTNTGRGAGSAYGGAGGGYGSAGGSGYGGGGSGYGGGGAGAYGGRGGGQGGWLGGGGANAYGRGGGAYGDAPQFRATGAPVARNEAPPKIVPIASLNAYQNRWTIKARVSQRSEVRKYSNARGEGKFISFELVDQHGGEIRGVAFNSACDRHEPVVQLGNIILVSKASLKPRKPGDRYNTTRHEYEITLDDGTLVELADDDPSAAVIPRVIYHFQKIERLEGAATGAVVDVLGVAESVQPASTITRRDGSEVQKRSLHVRDDSNRSIEVTMWAGYAADPGNQLQEAVDAGQYPIVAVKSAKVGDFNGKNLSTTSSSLVALDPDIPEAAQLRHWWESGGAAAAAVPLAAERGLGGGRADRRVLLAMIKDEGLGTSNNTAYVQVTATLTFLKRDGRDGQPGAGICYPACTLLYNGKPCNKKLTADGGVFWCERCQAQSPHEWRYLMTLTLSDHTAAQFLTCFQEVGTDVFGCAASELMAREGTAEFEARLRAATFRDLTMKLKVFEDTYNDETRIKIVALRAEPVDFVKESRVLLDFIVRLGAGQPICQAGAGPSASVMSYGSGGGGAPAAYNTGAAWGGSAAGTAGGNPWSTPPHAESTYGGGRAGTGAYGGGGHAGHGAYGGGGFIAQQGYGGGGLGGGGFMAGPGGF